MTGKPGVENSITGLSDYLRLMNESMQSLVKSNEKKRKVKAAKKQRNQKQKQKLVPQGSHRNWFLSQPSSILLIKPIQFLKGSILEDVGEYAGTMRPPPSIPIPHVARSTSPRGL